VIREREGRKGRNNKNNIKLNNDRQNRRGAK
jgi:hypothetical protein